MRKSRPIDVMAASTLVAGLLIGAFAATGDNPTPARAVEPGFSGVVAERPVDNTVQTVGGEVRTVAQVGERIVLGGTFTKVGPGIRGAAGLVDTATSGFGLGFPDVDGAVHAAAADGTGGWFVVGDFASVGGKPRANVAHIDATNAVTEFVADANGPAWAVAVAADALFVGGEFTEINGTPATRIARVERATGAVTWTAPLNAAVHALAHDAEGTRLYVGGAFTSIAGNSAIKRLVALDSRTGSVDAMFAPGAVSGTVRTLALVAPRLFLGGDFATVANVERKFLAAVDTTTGALAGWNARATGAVADLDVSPDHTTLYVVGKFFNIGGARRRHVAALDTTTASAGPLSVTGFRSGSVVQSVAFDPTSGKVEFAGNFRLDPERNSPYHLGRIDPTTNVLSYVVSPAATPLALARSPRVAFGVEVLVRDGTELLVAGDFSDYGVIDRPYLVAMDVATRALDLEFAPGPDQAVNTVKAAPDGSVLVGGDFEAIGGGSASKMARLDPATGERVPGFSATVRNGYVKDMVVDASRNRVYVGGTFNEVGGVPRAHLASLDITTGTLDLTFDLPVTGPTNSLDPTAAIRAMDLTPDALTLVAIGNFRFVDGIERPQVVQIDLSGPSATVNSWSTKLFDVPCSSGRIGWMRDISIAPDGSHFTIVTSGHFYYSACDAAVRFALNGGPGAEPVWYKKIGDTLESVAETPGAIYIGGHFRWLEAETQSQERFQIGALDPATGDGLSWNPTSDGFRGVLALESAPAGLLAGHDGAFFGGVAHGGFAYFAAPTPGLRVVKRAAPFFVVNPGGTVTHTITLQNTFAGRSVTVDSLTDSALGNLAGLGDCALPVELAPGSSYQCNVTESIAGTPGTIVTATTTAAGTANGEPVAGFDRSDVKVVNAPPSWLKLRVVGTLTQVPSPSADVQLNVIAMNLDPDDPLELTTLDSDYFGGLDGQGTCSVPQTIEPNGLYTCTFTAPVAGSFGQQRRVAFALTGTLAGSAVATSQSITYTVVAPPLNGEILFVVANPAALTPAENALTNRINARGYTTVHVDDHLVAATDAAGKKAVIISSSVVPTAVGSDLRGVSEPVIVLKHQVYDQMGLTGSGPTDRGLTSGSTLQVVAPTHPLAATISGPVMMDKNGVSRNVNWGVPAASARVVATVNANPVVFSYRPGDLLRDGSAAAGCRVATPGTNPAPSSWSASMLTMFDMALDYAITDCGQAMASIFAGNGQSGAGTDAVAATASSMNTPSEVIADADGTVYYSDTNNNRVRRIDASTGIVTTIAGSGASGYLGDGGAATAAQLRAPQGLAFGRDGALLIADTNNHVIRRVNLATGVISTMTGTGTGGSTGDGGPAAAARLRNPTMINTDAAGNLYIADRANHKIRRVDAVTGIIATVAGSGSSGFVGDNGPATAARLNNPYSVDVDSSGNLYIADYNNSRIRRVDGITGIITTVAGTGIAGFNGDGILAVGAELNQPTDVQVSDDGARLLIADLFNNRVRTMDLGTGVIEPVIGGGAGGAIGNGQPAQYALVNRAFGVTYLPDGSILVTDRNNRRIRMIGTSVA